MPKNIRRILIAVGAVVVIALALVFMKLVFPEEEVIPTETPAPTDAPVYYLTHRSLSEVSGIHFSRNDGMVLDIDITREDGKYVYKVQPEENYFGYDGGRFQSMMYTVSTITATSLITETPEDLADYGLADPWITLKVEFNDGTSTTVYIGNETPVQYFYYATTDQDNTIYTIGNYITSLFSRSDYEYRNVDTFPTYEDDDIYEYIRHFIITQRDGTNIEVFLDPELNMEGNITMSTYMMTQPYVSPCNSETVQDLLKVLATLKRETIVGDIDKDTLKDYGLDAPARLLLENKDGDSLEVVIGKASNGRCYGCIARQYDDLMAGTEDKITLLGYSMSDFDWLKLNFMKLQIRTPWIIDIHNVASLYYDFNGETFDMQLYEYDDVTGSGIEVVRTCSHINGKDIYEANTKRIYGRTLNFRQVGEIPAGAKYEESYSTSVTITLKDGTKRVMRFHKMNDRQYACELDGKVEYYVYVSNIDDVLNCLHRAMDDREVSLVYER